MWRLRRGRRISCDERRAAVCAWRGLGLKEEEEEEEGAMGSGSLARGGDNGDLSPASLGVGSVFPGVEVQTRGTTKCTWIPCSLFSLSLKRKGVFLLRIRQELQICGDRKEARWMDPSRPLLGRAALLSFSAAFLLLLPLSFYTPPVASPALQLYPSCDLSSPLDCADPPLFHLMMRSAIDAFPTVHFARFGRPVPGDPPSSSCDMAWRARSNSSASPTATATTKDYRRFLIARDPLTCAYSVTSIGDYHSGPNARKPRPGASNATAAPPPPPLSRSQFATGRYLSYLGGGDRCKPMPHYLRSLLCALAEARYLNRTLVLDLTLCLAASYTAGMPEEGKLLAFYIDTQHLQSVVGIVDQRQFWADWDRWGAQGQLALRLIEDTRVAPIKFSKAKDTLIVRKFGDVEPGNYWYHVCEGEAEHVLRPPRHAIRWAPCLMSIIDAIVTSMQRDFDSVHVGRNDEDLTRRIEEGVDVGRQVYVAGEGFDMVLLEALKANYHNLHYLDEFEGLWGKDSKWFLEMKRLNGGVPVEFDGYMRELVDKEVFLKGKKKVEVLR